MLLVTPAHTTRTHKRIPNIVAVGWQQYTGQQNDEIPIVLTESASVAHVRVSIYNSNNQLIETSTALTTKHPGFWIYRVQSENRAIDGCRILVEVATRKAVTIKKTYLIPL